MSKLFAVCLLVTLLGGRAAMADVAVSQESIGSICDKGDPSSLAFLERVQIHTPYVNQGLMVLPITVDDEDRVLYWEIASSKQGKPGTACSGVYMLSCPAVTESVGGSFEQTLCAEAHSTITTSDSYGRLYAQFDRELHQVRVCTERSAASLTFDVPVSIHTPFLWSDHIHVPLHVDGELRVLWWDVAEVDEQSLCTGVYEIECDSAGSRFERRTCRRAYGSF